MMRRQNSKYVFSLILAIFVLSYVTRTEASVENISIKPGEVVNENITISPGFAVMFQFPEDVTVLTLADQTSFSCDKMPTDATRVLCKPLTQNSFSTNLVVSTDTNEFNLVLKIDPSGQNNHPFKYVFYTGKLPVVGEHLASHTASGKPATQNIMDQLLDHFAATPCRLKGSSSVLEFRCLDEIKVGAETFIRFRLDAKSRESVRIIKMVMSQESFGGLTGLAVEEKAGGDIEYNLKSDTINQGSASVGILRMPRETDNNNGRPCLVVLTDKGKTNDVRVYGL